MTIALDNIIALGATRIAAITERTVTPISGIGGAAFHCQKRPIAILIHAARTTRAFDVEGAPVSVEDLTRRYPEQVARFEACIRASAEKFGGGSGKNYSS